MAGQRDQRKKTNRNRLVREEKRHVQEAGRRWRGGGGVGLDTVSERRVERQRRPLHPPGALLAVHHGHELCGHQQETMKKEKKSE